MSELIYLATPYSHPDPAVREKRFKAVNRVAAQLMGQGKFVYSPISHTHPIALAGDLPKGWDFWDKYCRVMLERCTAMVVLMQEGWKESVGVTNEIKIAKELGIPIIYLKEKLEFCGSSESLADGL